MGGVNLEHLEAAQMFLFGDVKFLHLLLLLMFLDILTGVFKAARNRNLWSRKSLFGYARKILILVVIILANVVDQILGLNGAVTYATVLFYLANEGLSILENLAAVGVTVPGGLEKRLKTIQEQEENNITSEIKEEFTTKRSGQNEN
ncbi:phage holin family protein [Oceanobacillus kimchii]|uniref:phage holin family protein n=1 Tax=Oceanobacillus kimchii TaxID=746691 RepID=UPI00232CC019|nr:phage holin family protein [Oceanobacillus kimchii]